MSFFNLSEGTLDTTGSFELGGGNIEPIPNNTQLKSIVDEAKWDEYNGDRFISLRWTVLDGEYANRKIFQKVHVCSPDNKKRDKAIRMLAAVDTNAGGNLMKLGHEPSDMDLAVNLLNKPQAILVQVWELDKDQNGQPVPQADRKRGNWISAVAPISAYTPATKAPQQHQQAQNQPMQQVQAATGTFDSDIPF